MAHLSLSDVPVGRRVRIAQLSSQPETCSRLRELGFCENAVIRCVNKASGNIICEVCNTRIGLNQLVASSIYVSSFE
jgi:ferrous iron transport protein A